MRQEHKGNIKSGAQKVKLPKAPSKGEAKFSEQLRKHGIEFVSEYRFAPPRMWRADFFISKRNILIEIEGGTYYGKSRHSSGEGYEKDAEKYNQASYMGFKLYRYTTRQVMNEDAIKHLLEVL
jgi:very-short-patch-repair endonuclease